MKKDKKNCCEKKSVKNKIKSDEKGKEYFDAVKNREDENKDNNKDE